MLENLKFLKYVRSFTEGRVRLRHPALENPRIAARARPGAASPLWPTRCASWPKRP